MPSLAAQGQQESGWFGLGGALRSLQFVRRAGDERVGYWLEEFREGETGGGGCKMSWAWAIGQAQKKLWRKICGIYYFGSLANQERVWNDRSFTEGSEVAAARRLLCGEGGGVEAETRRR